MKAIINNLLYDTDLSTVVYTDKETKRVYYQTENIRYFTLFPNGEIQPTSEETIKDILGKNDIDKYIEIFGNVEDA